MNFAPNQKGIGQRWVPGKDARVEIRDACGLSKGTVDKVLSATWDHILSRKRTVIVGVGAFEWRKWHRKIPTGRMVKTWRLAFRPSQEMRRNGGPKWA